MANASIKIPLVFSTDRNYVFPTVVTISSALKNAHDGTFYDIYIQTTDDCVLLCNSLVDFLKKKYSNFKVSYLLMNPDEFVNSSNTSGHVTMPTFYRLKLAEQLLLCNRCIVLDSDIIIRDDLSSIFNYDMKDNYIAGVKSWDAQQPTAANERRRVIDGLPDMNQYILLGVLLMDLDKIRNDNMTDMFLSHMTKGYPHDDQDVFNVCCYDKITFLPQKFNFVCKYCESGFPHGKLVCSQKELQDALKFPVIVHFPGIIDKPWNNRYSVPYSDEWWQCASLFINTKEYKDFSLRHLILEEKYQFARLLNYSVQKENVVVCGFTVLGKMITAFLLKNSVDVFCIMDNDLNKRNLTFMGLPVKTLESLLKGVKKTLNFSFIITNQKHGHEIENLLKVAGIDKDNIYMLYE